MHINRSNIEKFWPIPRKGNKMIALSDHNQRESIPLVVVMRDILKLVRNKKELKKLLNEKQVLINTKIVKETNFPISLFDTLTLIGAKKSYRAELSLFKKMMFNEITEKESHTRLYKVMNKKILSDKTTQVNLIHGVNINTKEKVTTGDSVVYDFKEKKIIKTIPMEKGKNAHVIEGKHAGKNGKITEIVERGGKQIAKITFGNEKLNVWTKNIIVSE